MTSYTFPFAPGAKLIELGGGSSPRVRPNVDMRPGPTVDLVADFNRPIPQLAPAQWDGVLCIYALEHISWRNARTPIAEMHRILKPGGIAVCLVPNLYEQCKKAIAEWESGTWTAEQVSQMIFGDQDYPENSHKVGWSPKQAGGMFREAGFFAVKVFPLPGCETDMVIEATKSQVAIVRSL